MWIKTTFGTRILNFASSSRKTSFLGAVLPSVWKRNGQSSILVRSANIDNAGVTGVNTVRRLLKDTLAI